MRRLNLLVLIFSLSLPCAVFAQTGGSVPVTSAEYHFSPVIDNDILPNVYTEIWGKLYRPEDLGYQPHPLIILLHGNHVTCGSGRNPIVEQGCSYTYTGTCPAGQSVVQNHLGYEYLANELASHGYIVVSINANRGITCGAPASGDNGLVLARGRLVLKHLALLSQWNRFGNQPSSLGDLQGKIDFSQVGLFGHSRGGEGVRAAFNLYRDSGSVWKKKIRDGVQFRGIFEIGPVDGMSSRVLDADGVAWNVILPMCDGDVTDLEGMRVFDRMLNHVNEKPALPKSMLAIWGANHDYYNTEWQKSESPGCVGTAPLWSGDVGSSAQRQTAMDSVVPFFMANVGVNQDTTLENVLNPLGFTAPGSPREDHAFLLSSNFHVVSVLQLVEQHLSTNVTASLESVPEHDAALIANRVRWVQAGTSFETDWKPAGQGFDLNQAKSFDFRISRTVDAINTDSSTSFHVSLAFQDGTYSQAVPLSSYASVVAPVGMGGNGTSQLHMILQTVRIPLQDLLQGSTKQVRGVRFSFDQTATGEIFVSQFAFSRFSATSDLIGFQLPTSLPDPSVLFRAFARGPEPEMPLAPSTASAVVPISTLSIPGDDRLGKVKIATDDPRSVDVEVSSSEPFHVGNALPVLLADGKMIGVGRIPETGDLHTMIYRVKRSDTQALPATFKLDTGFKGNRITHGMGDHSPSVFTPKE